MTPSFDMMEFAVLRPELTVLVGALLLILFGAFRGARATGGITLLAMGVMIAAACNVYPQDVKSDTFFNEFLIIDQFTQFVKFMILTASTLETSMRGVFAAGDVRLGSTKQAASAVGEGATAALMIREYLKTV